MTQQDKDWKSFFEDSASKFEASNNNTGLIIDLSIPDTIKEKSISNFASKKVTIACCFSPVTKSISFIHSITDLAGGIFFPESKIVALSGFQESAIPTWISNDSIITTTDKYVLNLAALIKMDSIEDINTLDSTDDLDIVDRDLLSTLTFTLLPSFL